MLDARTITVALLRHGEPFGLPHYTPQGWHECDLMRLYSNDQGWTEFEIKVSRKDWKRDEEKRQRQVKGYRDGAWTILIPSRTKHERLAAGDPVGPNQFYYLTPLGVLQVAELPTWAGLVEVVDGPRPSFRMRKRAPTLHDQQPSLPFLAQVRRECLRRLVPFLAGGPVDVATADPVI